MKTIKKVIFIILFLVIDLALWIGIGLVLLNYEDFYSEDKGTYWSLSSMTSIEKIAFVSYYLWILFNIIMVLYLVFYLIKKYK